MQCAIPMNGLMTLFITRSIHAWLPSGRIAWMRDFWRLRMSSLTLSAGRFWRIVKKVSQIKRKKIHKTKNDNEIWFGEYDGWNDDLLNLNLFNLIIKHWIYVSQLYYNQRKNAFKAQCTKFGEKYFTPKITKISMASKVPDLEGFVIR